MKKKRKKNTYRGRVKILSGKDNILDDFYNQFISSIIVIAVQNSLFKLKGRCNKVVVVWDENYLQILCKLAFAMLLYRCEQATNGKIVSL